MPVNHPLQLDWDRFEAVIFDMDGVLIDSEPLHEEAQRIVFRTYGLTVPPEAFVRFKGQTEEAVFDEVVTNYAEQPFDAEVLIAEKHRTYAALMDRLQLIEGALPLVKRLVDEGRTLGLATSATPENQRQVFERWRLAPYFRAVVTAADVRHAKPHPEPYLTTAERLGVSPKACLVFEDSTHGVTSARRAGCTVVGLTTSFTAARLREAGAHHTFSTFFELQ